jgi:succinyl-CoA synthetase beta subunit
VVFLNLFTQVLRCDQLAEAIVAAFAETGPRVVARLAGQMAERGRAILQAAGMQVSESYESACDLAVAASLAGAGVS